MLLLAQILVQHIRAILPDLKARISTQMITLQKELASYGELTESKVNFVSFLVCLMLAGCTRAGSNQRVWRST
jgi:dynamin 1-like protein